MPKMISKSSFLKGLQCHKALYLKFNHPELADEISEMQQAIFQSGTDVGLLAQELYPGGINPSSELPKNFRKSINETRDLVENKQPVIYEAGFETDGLLCFIDILVYENNRWHAVEVKSSTSIHDINIWDTAFQYYVMKKWGLDLVDISLCHINNQYVRQGPIDIHQLFVQESVLEKILPLQSPVEQQISALQKMLGIPSVPDIDIGPHCNTPYTCEFHGHCWQHIPDYSIFNIGNLWMSKKFELYKQGVINITDVPSDFPLNDNQWMQVTAEINKKPVINKEAIESFLSELKYPLYFLDFETFGTPVPMFDSSKPYQQIPFQYSLHIQQSKDGVIEHREFLAENEGDPRFPFIERLIQDLGNKGHIIVYNQCFEMARLRELKEFLQLSAPGRSPVMLSGVEALNGANSVEVSKGKSEQINAIDKILSRIFDLMRPFQKKWYYRPEMRGKYSIKNVLPAILSPSASSGQAMSKGIPEMSYENLDIQEGGSASRAFFELYGEVDDDMRRMTRNNLQEYCKLDTLAMVEILKRLENVFE